MTEKSWFVFYTKSRQEKKVNDLLTKRGYDSFLPLQSVVRQWSDRKKRVVVPLFNSYVFVFAREYEIASILTVPGVAWSIRHNGKPATVRQEEIDLVKRFVSSGLFLESTASHNINFRTGDKMKIMDGPLAGLTGVLSSDTKDRKFMVEIESIQQVIRVQIPAYLLEKA